MNSDSIEDGIDLQVSAVALSIICSCLSKGGSIDSLDKTGESSHELSLKLEGFSLINKSLIIHVSLFPDIVEFVREVFLSILLWEIIPLHDNFLACLLSFVLGDDVKTRWFASLVLAGSCIPIEN